MRIAMLVGVLAACGDKAGDTGAETTDVPTDAGSPPVVGALSFGTDEDTPIDFTLVASDPEGQPLTYAWVGAPTLGVVSGTLPAVHYVPDPNVNGAEALVFTVSDGGNTVQGTVTIDIRAVNDAPTVEPISGLTTPEDTPLQIPVVVNDVDGDDVTVSGASPDHGDMGGAPPTLQYEPDPHWNGTEVVVLSVSDGIETVELTFDIVVTPVNDAPVAVDDGFEIVEGGELLVSKQALVANDLDLEGDTLSCFGFGTPTDGDVGDLGADIRITPPPDFVGVIELPYQVSDGELLGDGKVVVVVLPGNDAPIGVADSFGGAEDTPLVVHAPGVLANDIDPEDDELRAVLVDAPTRGVVELDDDGSFVYTPDPDIHGADSFTYTATDGEFTTAEIRVDLSIAAVNDDPVAVDDVLETYEDVPLVLDAASGVLANDLDVDGDSLNAALLLGVLHGTLDLAFDGSLTYIPDPGYSGTDDFVYQVTDDFGGLSFGGDVFITVHPVEDLPVAVADAYATDEDTTLAVAAPGLLANDSDEDGDGLSASLGVQAAHGTAVVSSDGSFTYTPEPDFHGVDSFGVDVTDGKGTVRSTATVTVAPINDAPIAVDDSWDVGDAALVVAGVDGVLANDTDVDGDDLTAAVVGSPAHGILALGTDGGFVYIPDAGYAGLDSFTYVADDGDLQSAPATVLLVVVPPNEAPIAAPDFYVADAGVLLIVPGEDGLLANDVDPEGMPLEAILVIPPEHGDLNLNVEGSFDYMPDDDFGGIDEATYVAVDSEGALSEPTTVIFLVIAAPPDVPVAVADHYDGFEDTPIDIAAPGVLANDVGDDLVALLMAIPLHGAVTLDSDGGFSYGARSPLPEDYAGIDVFSYVASNADGTSGMAIVELDLAAVDDAPRGNPDFFAVVAGGTLLVPAPGVLANDSDPEGDPITVDSLTDPPEFGVAEITADGALTYTPDLAFTDGVDTLTYTPVANGLLGDPVTVTITVFSAEGIEGDRPPRAAPDRYVSVGGFVLEVHGAQGVLTNDIDVDGDELRAEAGIVTTALGGRADVAEDGSFVYTPPAEVGDAVDEFDVLVLAGPGADTATVRIALVGRAWWVDGDLGDDAADGGSATPLATLDEALVRATAGDIVRLVGAAPLSLDVAVPVGVSLLGAGLPLVAHGTVLESAGAPPVVTAAGGLSLPAGTSAGGFVLRLDGSAVRADRGARLTALDLVDAGPDALVSVADRHAHWALDSVTADGALRVTAEGEVGHLDLYGSAFTAVTVQSGPDAALGFVAQDSAADGWFLVADGAFVLAADEAGECVDTDLGALAAAGNTSLDGGPPAVTASGTFTLR